jgi:hypothetical protein
MEEGEEASFSRVIANGTSKYRFNDKEVSWQVILIAVVCTYYEVHTLYNTYIVTQHIDTSMYTM